MFSSDLFMRLSISANLAISFVASLSGIVHNQTGAKGCCRWRERGRKEVKRLNCSLPILTTDCYLTANSFIFEFSIKCVDVGYLRLLLLLLVFKPLVVSFWKTPFCFLFVCSFVSRSFIVSLANRQKSTHGVCSVWSARLLVSCTASSMYKV